MQPEWKIKILFKQNSGKLLGKSFFYMKKKLCSTCEKIIFPGKKQTCLWLPDISKIYFFILGIKKTASLQYKVIKKIIIIFQEIENYFFQINLFVLNIHHPRDVNVHYRYFFDEYALYQKNDSTKLFHFFLSQWHIKIWSKYTY